MLTHPPCLEWTDLLQRYSKAIQARSHLIKLLAQAAEEESDVFAAVLCRCEDSRALCARLQREIYEHFKGHQWQAYTGVREGPVDPARFSEQ